MQNIIILISSVWIGAIIGYFFRNKKSDIPNYLLVFSGGFLLSLTLLEIFPHIYSENPEKIGIWILAGVLVQIFLEFLTKGVEHGHLHHEKSETNFPIALLIGLILHSFLEGVPISGEISHEDHHHHHETNLVWGIFVHNLPISFLLSYFLFKSKLKPVYSFIILLVFSLSAPIGSIIGTNFLGKYIDESLALVGGIFLHISSLIIFESNKKHSFNLFKLLFILAGMIAASLIL